MALAGTLNVPAVRQARAVGVDELFLRLNAAGLRFSENGGFHGPSLALGSAEVTLLDLTNAYRMLANGGVGSAVRWREGTLEGRSRQVFEPGATRQVSAILADGASKAPTFGFDSPLVTRWPTAMQTGTRNDMRDNWCIGYDAARTAGCWVGNAHGGPMHAVSDVSRAAPVWRQVMVPIDSTGATLAKGPGGAPESRVVGVPQGGSPPASSRSHGIVSPTTGRIWMPDPTIPAPAQHLVFEGPDGQWLLCGQRIGQGSRVRWSPRPGRHTLELRSIDNGLSDRVAFEVRTVPVAPADGR